MSKRYVLYTHEWSCDYGEPKFQNLQSSNLNDAIEESKHLLNDKSCVSLYTKYEVGVSDAMLFEVTSEVNIHALMFGSEQELLAKRKAEVEAELAKVQEQLKILAGKMANGNLTRSECGKAIELQEQRSALKTELTKLLLAASLPATNG